MAIQGPLTGVRVIELGNMVAPDTCTRMMADLGAEVIKVENTALGDNFRVWPRTIGAPTRDDFNPIFDNLNANKKSISVNMKTKEGLDIMYQLLGSAEIFITNIRTKGLERMGLGYDVLKETFPKIVNTKFTAQMETGLDRVGEGEEDYVELLHTFYDDFEKIQLVLNDKIIKIEDFDKGLFKGNSDIIEGKKLYKIDTDALDKIDSYIEIYESKTKTDDGAKVDGE